MLKCGKSAYFSSLQKRQTLFSSQTHDWIACQPVKIYSVHHVGFIIMARLYCHEKHKLDHKHQDARDTTSGSSNSIGEDTYSGDEVSTESMGKKAENDLLARTYDFQVE